MNGHIHTANIQTYFSKNSNKKRISKRKKKVKVVVAEAVKAPVVVADMSAQVADTQVVAEALSLLSQSSERPEIMVA